MVQLGLMDGFRCKVLSWDNELFPKKEPVNFLGKPNLTKSEMHEVIIHK